MPARPYLVMVMVMVMVMMMMMMMMVMVMVMVKVKVVVVVVVIGVMHVVFDIYLIRSNLMLRSIYFCSCVRKLECTLSIISRSIAGDCSLR